MDTAKQAAPATPTETIVLGGGCFWCIEAAYSQIRGVIEITSGYAGGAQANPSYDQVCTGATGHAEVVKVTFDPQEVSLEQILDIFWVVHNPTTPNRQGNDIGPQYRSIILYNDEQQRAAIQASIDAVSPLWNNEIVTQVESLKMFYPAEEVHQDFFAKNPQHAYCQAVINPKLRKLREQFTELLA